MTPTPTPSPTATPTAAAVAPPAPRPSPTIAATPPTTDPAPASWEPWLFGGAGLVLLVVLWLRFQRDRPAAPPDEMAGMPVAGAAPPPAGPAPIRARGPWVTLALRPTRAGLNMVTAVADCEITLTNEGSAPAHNVRSTLGLVAAHGTPQADIDAANLEPITRSLVPAFTLAPGEARTFRGVASARLDTLPTMEAAGREMLVPMVLLIVQHQDAAGVEYRTTQGFVVGVERVDSAKLAPFWLDSVRMIDQVAARASGAPDRRRVEAG